MSWDVSIQDKFVTHDCPNCGGHEGAVTFEQNITYNVGTMLRRAGLHPQVLNGMKVSQAYGIVINALQLMEDNRAYFGRYDADNGWGTCATTITAVRAIYKAMDEGMDDDVLRWQ
jgi:hypothetical protein